MNNQKLSRLLRRLIIIGFLTAPVLVTQAKAERRNVNQISLGMAIPTNDLKDISERGLDLQYQYLRAVHPNAYIGGQLDGVIFGEHKPPSSPNYKSESSHVNAVSLMLVGKICAKPYPADAIPFILFGGGIAQTKSDGSMKESGVTSMSSTYTAGLGVDLDLKNNRTFGMSVRYQTLHVLGVKHSGFVNVMLSFAW